MKMSMRTMSAVGVAAGLVSGVLAQPVVPTTKTDFYLHGSQPAMPSATFAQMQDAAICASCHGDYTEAHSPFERWRYSMMAQAYRDPVYHAAMRVAEKDAGGVSDLCMRCHTPMGWFQNRATNIQGSELFPSDADGVSCSVCHRAVDPDYKATNPTVDLPVLQALGVNRPPATGQGGELANGHMVIDPEDRRRGPFNLGQFFYHEWIQSPLHKSADLCAACHDVSNPAYSKQPDGSYVANALDTPHPTGNQYDMFPIERLYSEWKQSDFATGGVTLVNPDGSGRYGGNLVTSYSTCQDCHMPKVEGTGCAPFLGPPRRPNVPQHNFAGANTWVLKAVNNLFDPGESMMDDPAMIDASIARAVTILQRATDLELTTVSDKLKVRVINQSGHKVPSGYAEGRRMWVNVRFFDAQNQLLAERGAYNTATGALTTSDTKVYEQKQGMDAHASLLTGYPMGESFHFAVNNKVLYDSRIPPRGFTNAGFAGVQAAPIAYSYADGQHWDDTLFTVPPGTASAQVNVYHQTSTKEYMEFLRDTSNDPIMAGDFIQPPAGSTATTFGQVAYEQWTLLGRSTPTLMDSGTVAARACKPDVGMVGGVVGADGLLDNNDFVAYINLFFSSDPLADMGVQGGQQGSDGLFDNNDFIVYINVFFGACP